MQPPVALLRHVLAPGSRWQYCFPRVVTMYPLEGTQHLRTLRAVWQQSVESGFT